MRDSVLEQIKLISPQGVKVTKELPYDESGIAVYLKNPKTIYVDNMEVENDPFIQTLSGLNIVNEINIVRIYFTTDAKNQIANYDNLVSQLRALKSSIELPGATRREALVSIRYEGDLTVTELEYRLTRLN